VTRFADPSAQMSSTCLVSRRFPPIFCARRSGAVCAESAITASAGDNNASVALAWVERPLAAAVVLLREYAIIGNSYGLAIYSMPKITASHPKLLMAAPFNGASSSSEDRVRQISTSLCTASTSDVANNGVCATALSSSVLVPSLRLAVSGSVRPAAGAKHADRSGSDGTQIAAVLPVVQPAAAVASSESSGFPGVLTWQSSTLLCLMRQADPPASHEGFWSSVLGGSARIPVALVGLVVGVGFQIWRRSQRLYRDRLAAAPRQSDDDDVPWPGPDHAVMESLLRGLGGERPLVKEQRHRREPVARSGSVGCVPVNSGGARSNTGTLPSPAWLRTALEGTAADRAWSDHLRSAPSDRGSESDT
jgi:hypothetical protein